MYHNIVHPEQTVHIISPYNPAAIIETATCIVMADATETVYQFPKFLGAVPFLTKIHSG